MKTLISALALLAALTGLAIAQEGAVPKGVPHLDHVFFIMMENHGYTEILHNPNAQFINQLRQVRQSCHQLLRCCPSQPDQLSGGCRRIELRRSQRQPSGLAQQLRIQPRHGHRQHR